MTIKDDFEPFIKDEDGSASQDEPNPNHAVDVAKEEQIAEEYTD